MLKQAPISGKASSRLGDALKSLPLTPDSITIASVLVAFFGFLSAASGDYAMALSFFAFAFALDAVDGAVARAKNMASKNGAYLDGICDRLVEFFAIAGFMPAAFSYYSRFGISYSAWLLMVLFFGTCMTSFAKAYAGHKGVLSNEQAEKMPGLLERTERVILLFISLLLASLGQIEFAYYAIALCGTLSAITFLQRSAYALNPGRK
jgi:archaetidylinositol phosphate synthase